MRPYRIIVALIVVFGAPAESAPRLLGQPPVSVITPELETYPQSFSLASALDGTIYVGSVEGVLSYDGARWEMFQLPGKSTVRSLAVDGDGRVYAGGYQEFGYFQPQPDGTLTWQDLTPQVESRLDGRPLNEIWRVALIQGRVFFGALRELISYDPQSGEIEHWHHPGRFGDIFEIDEEVWVQFRGEGLRRLVRGAWQPVPGSEHLASHLFDVMERPDGSRFGILQGGAWPVVYGTPLDYEALLGPSDGYVSGATMPDGTVIMSTSTGELVSLAADNTVRRIRVSDGWISGVSPWRNGEYVLAVSGEKLIAIKWPPDWSVIGSDSGLKGAVFGLQTRGDQTFVFGSAGVYQVAEDGHALEELAWTVHEAFDMQLLDDRAVLVDTYSLREIDDRGTVRSLSADDLYPYTLIRSRFDPDRIWVTDENGIGYYSIAERRYTKLGGLEGLPFDTLEELGPQSVLVASSLSGEILRLSVPRGAAEVEIEQRYSSGEGLRQGDPPGASLWRLDDSIYATHTMGIDRFDRTTDRWVTEPLEGLETLRLQDEWFSLFQAPDRTWYAVGDYRALARRPDGDWITLAARTIGSGALVSLEFPYDSTPYFGMGQQILVYTGPLEPVQGSATPVRIVSARLDRAGKTRPLDLDGAARHTITAGQWGIELRYAVMDLGAPDAVRYSARMLGLEDEFSSWSAGSTVTYSHLDPGEYQFEVRGRGSDGVVTVAAPFRFIVSPRWYQTRLAQGGALLLIILASVLAGSLIMHHRSRLLRLRNEELEQAVRERAGELVKANRKLAVLANQDGLTGLANRRQFDEFLEGALRDAGGNVALIMADFDRFKSFNDQHGHVAGDELLKAYARFLASTVGDDPRLLAARYGGEEFAVVLAGDAAQEIELLARRLHSSWNREPTLSIGHAVAKPDDTAQDLIDRADRALYAAKRGGRNRIVAA